MCSTSGPRAVPASRARASGSTSRPAPASRARASCWPGVAGSRLDVLDVQARASVEGPRLVLAGVAGPCGRRPGPRRRRRARASCWPASRARVVDVRPAGQRRGLAPRARRRGRAPASRRAPRAGQRRGLAPDVLDVLAGVDGLAPRARRPGPRLRRGARASCWPASRGSRLDVLDVQARASVTGSRLVLASVAGPRWNPPLLRVRPSAETGNPRPGGDP